MTQRGRSLARKEGAAGAVALGLCGWAGGTERSRSRLRQALSPRQDGGLLGEGVMASSSASSSAPVPAASQASVCLPVQWARGGPGAP